MFVYICIKSWTELIRNGTKVDNSNYDRPSGPLRSTKKRSQSKSPKGRRWFGVHLPPNPPKQTPQRHRNTPLIPSSPSPTSCSFTDHGFPLSPATRPLLLRLFSSSLLRSIAQALPRRLRLLCPLPQDCCLGCSVVPSHGSRQAGVSRVRLWCLLLVVILFFDLRCFVCVCDGRACFVSFYCFNLLIACHL